MTFKKYVYESIKKMPDEKIDSFIDREWNGEALTFQYNEEAIMEIGAILKKDDVIVTKDKKFFHIPLDLDIRTNNLIKRVLLKYKVKEV